VGGAGNVKVDGMDRLAGEELAAFQSGLGAVLLDDDDPEASAGRGGELGSRSGGRGGQRLEGGRLWRGGEQVGVGAPDGGRGGGRAPGCFGGGIGQAIADS